MLFIRRMDFVASCSATFKCFLIWILYYLNYNKLLDIVSKLILSI